MAARPIIVALNHKHALFTTFLFGKPKHEGKPNYCVQFKPLWWWDQF